MEGRGGGAQRRCGRYNTRAHQESQEETLEDRQDGPGLSWIAAQNGPRGPRESLKMAEEGLQRDPGRPKKGPGRPGAPSWTRIVLTTDRNGPKGPQEESAEIHSPKGPPEWPEIAPPPCREETGEGGGKGRCTPQGKGELSTR